MFCPKCGKQINDNDIFCAYCGETMIPGDPGTMPAADQISSPPANQPQPAPSYAQHPQPFSQPYPVKKKKGGAAAIIIALSVLLAAAVGGIIFLIVSNSDDDDADSTSRKSSSTAETTDTEEEDTTFTTEETATETETTAQTTTTTEETTATTTETTSVTTTETTAAATSETTTTVTTEPPAPISDDSAAKSEASAYSTRNRPTFDEFDWCYGQNGLIMSPPQGADMIDNYFATGGGWKSMLIYEDNEGIGATREIDNIELFFDGNRVTLSVDWYYVEPPYSEPYYLDDGTITQFTGSVNGTVIHTAADLNGETVTIDLYYFWRDNGKQYAIGALYLPDGSSNYLALVRK